MPSQVTAIQRGSAIFTVLVSFHKPESSPLEHQFDMPACPDPDSLPTQADMYAKLLDDPRVHKKVRKERRREREGERERKKERERETHL
jgi:acyl-CoA thioesterase